LSISPLEGAFSGAFLFIYPISEARAVSPQEGFGKTATKLNLALSVIGVLCVMIPLAAAGVAKSASNEEKIQQLLKFHEASLSGDVERETRLRNVENTTSVVSTKLSDMITRLERIERKIDR
jgi:hypothetical protein